MTLIAPDARHPLIERVVEKPARPGSMPRWRCRHAPSGVAECGRLWRNAASALSSRVTADL